MSHSINFKTVNKGAMSSKKAKALRRQLKKRKEILNLNELYRMSGSCITFSK